MKDGELIKKFEEEFEALKKKLKLKTSFEELDSLLYLSDRILKEGYVPVNLLRTICSLMIGKLKESGIHLHSLVIPNPQSMPSITESRLFNDKEKEEFKNLISKIMFLSSTNALNEIKKDKLGDGKLIDDSMRFWNEECKPKLTAIMEKINAEWEKDSKLK